MIGRFLGVRGKLDNVQVPLVACCACGPPYWQK